MEKFKRVLKKIFFLPLFLTVMIAVPAFALVIFSLSMQIDGPVAYFSYAASAYALTITCTALPRLGNYIAAVREHADRHPVVKRLLKIPFVKRFFQDVRFKTEVSLYMGLFINLLYIVMKMFSGIYYRSFWFIALAIYYILLALMRYMLLRRRKNGTDGLSMEDEIRRYRMCGIVLLMMNQALMGIVVYMVQQNKGFYYPGMLIYAMAAYSFYSIITAVINIIKFRRHGSPVLSAAKAINLVAAMVSILSLTTAMISRFGGDDTSGFRQIMTACVGGCVCTIVIGMAVYMIWRAATQMKRLRLTKH